MYILQVESEAHKQLTRRMRELAEDLVVTKRDRNEKRRVCRRQALELASLRKWHETALLTQAGQFKDDEARAEKVLKENVRTTFVYQRLVQG
jgi:hypothetical protein